jgi:hypothetical protein
MRKLCPKHRSHASLESSSCGRPKRSSLNISGVFRLHTLRQRCFASGMRSSGHMMRNSVQSFLRVSGPHCCGLTPSSNGFSSYCLLGHRRRLRSLSNGRTGCESPRQQPELWRVSIHQMTTPSTMRCSEPLRTSRHLLPPPPCHPPCRCLAAVAELGVVLPRNEPWVFSPPFSTESRHPLASRVPSRFKAPWRTWLGRLGCSSGQLFHLR